MANEKTNGCGPRWLGPIKTCVTGAKASEPSLMSLYSFCFQLALQCPCQPSPRSFALNRFSLIYKHPLQGGCQQKFRSGDKLSFWKSLHFSMFVSKHLFEDFVNATISCFYKRKKTLQNVTTQVPCRFPSCHHVHFRIGYLVQERITNDGFGSVTPGQRLYLKW